MTPDIQSRVKLTYEDYVRIPNDRNRHEIIDGDHHVNPAPSTYHQAVSKRLQFLLYTKIELTSKGVAYYAPVDVELDEHNILQPDIVVVLAEQEQIILQSRIKGIPDMVVEILSPSSIDNDTRRKRDVYERLGVPEYWIVDPFEHQVDQLVLNDGNYQSQPVEDVRTLSIMPDIEIDLNEVW